MRFFFFKQKTAYEMRISDWSSDVCSSDLMNVLQAEGVNLGLRKMAAATNTHSLWELLRIARWHVEGSAYDRALAMIVEAHAALPMAAFWGQGQSASSDGQFFLATEQGEALNLINAKYGNVPGLKG